MQKNPLVTAIVDVVATLKRISLVGMLGWQDVRQRYQRSALGPFWLTISMGVMIGTIGIVFGQIFKSPVREFLPFLAVGIIVWGYISSMINDACSGFIAAEGMLKQLPIPMFTHILRLVWRNILILGHNVVILPLVFLAVGKPLSWMVLWVIPGLLLVTLNLTWLSLVVGVLSARYRDLPPIINSIIQVVFYLTPIIWMPSLLPGRSALYLLDLNPAYHLLEVVRAPLLGDMPSMMSWWVLSAMALLGCFLTLLFYGRYKRRIAYWL
ncbi:MAG: transporter permease [Gammaproteobacteria bacterium]|jgi:lipopolysaccharide transport system permease protein|nr:transporter permease [Gammaproteobacteria bacterium]